MPASHAALTQILEALPDPALVLTRQGTIALANDSAHRLFGYRAGGLLDQVIGVFVSGLDPHGDELSLCDARARGRPGFQVEVRSRPLALDGEPLTLCVLREVDADGARELQSTRNMDRLRALREIDLAIIGNDDLVEVLETVLREVTLQLGVDAADILLLNPRTRTLEFGAGRGFRGYGIERTSLALGEGTAGRAAKERRPLMVADLARERGFGRGALLRTEGFVAYHAVPLVTQGAATGVLELFHRAPLEPERSWLDFRDALAGQAAIAVQSGRLYRDLEQVNAELVEAYDTTIEGWARALELRDRETLGHSVRVTDLTLRMARLAGLGEADLAHVRRGALLHDIGKVGVPDSILLKPGPLDAEEWAVMRRHPVFAFELLRPIPYLLPALEIPLCHHERWDGAGYPQGLRGEEIPLAARLFAVVDVWDALRSDRPYRSGWPEDRVFSHLRGEAGTHFDPSAVELFFQAIDTVTPPVLEPPAATARS